MSMELRKLRFALTLGAAIAVPLVGIARAPSEPVALVFIVLLGLVSVKRPVEGLSLVLLVNGFSTLARASNPGSMILAGFTTLSSVAAILGAFVWIALRPRNALIPVPRDRMSWNAALLGGAVACFVAATIVACVRGATTPVRLALLIREHIVPAALFFVALLAVRRGDQLEKLIKMFGVGAAIVAAANLVHYAFGISGLDANRIVIHGGSSTPALRQFLIFQGIRLYHILGLSTQGGGAVYYGLAAIGLYYAAANTESGRRRIWWVPITILLAAGIFTFSNSWLVLMAVFAVIEAYRRVGRDIFVRIILLPVLVGGMLLIVAVPGVTGGRSVLSYGMEAFIRPGIEVLQSQGPVGILIGQGLSLISGGMVGLQDQDVATYGAHVARDRWLLVVQLQMGFIGFALAALVMIGAATTLRASRRLEDPRDRQMVGTALTLVLLSLSFAHGFVLIERLFSPIMYALAGGAVGICLSRQRLFVRPLPGSVPMERWAATT